jgi:hypothetical protein
MTYFIAAVWEVNEYSRWVEECKKREKGNFDFFSIKYLDLQQHVAVCAN